jgi:drug/metabolite transporter (DMT)-like permease
LNTPFFAAGLALIAAFCWGTGDFTGGLAARRSDAFRTVLLSYGVGLVGIVIAALARGEPFTTLPDLGWGALAGLSGMVGLGFLFRGFTLGRMGIVSPVSAVLGTTLPVLFEAFTKGLPRTQQLVGFGVALVGIWLLSRPERLSGRPKGLGMAVIAGLGFGGFFTFLSQVGPGAVLWPLAAGRLASVTVMAVYALLSQRKMDLQHSPRGLFILAGVLDVSGNLFFLLAIQNGRLDVTAVLGSLYPAMTALMAWVLLKERITRLQALGVAAAVLAIVLITV